MFMFSINHDRRFISSIFVLSHTKVSTLAIRLFLAFAFRHSYVLITNEGRAESSHANDRKIQLKRKCQQKIIQYLVPIRYGSSKHRSNNNVSYQPLTLLRHFACSSNCNKCNNSSTHCTNCTRSSNAKNQSRPMQPYHLVS